MGMTRTRRSLSDVRIARAASPDVTVLKGAQGSGVGVCEHKYYEALSVLSGGTFLCMGNSVSMSADLGMHG